MKKNIKDIRKVGKNTTTYHFLTKRNNKDIIWNEKY